MRDLSAPETLLDTSSDMALRLSGVRLILGGRAVLDGVDLALPGRGVTAVMGPNGAGKSQLLKLIHGLTVPTAGTATWNGRPAATMTATQALVFQKPVLLRRSVAANLDFVLKSRRKDRALAQALLTHVGLADKARQPARALSGGEAQRLAMARALALEPQVLLLDEPTASLDPASVLAIEHITLQARDQGVKVILVTHDIGQARRMADDVVFLNRGRITEHSPAERFFTAPRSTEAKDFLNGRLIV
ncbi:ATP-binding cassette domain-containing protein [Ponticoccus alexandrii]|uniref:ATP-binding cassette domain-containing protein n=1 Tax=Ponticoccus alexandrii TaxID=1943633 RepID=A0ABX7F5B1_9RHOB|nr:ATP-binding cassette domain-containing protein [Ponticoccus alexandrii]ETA53628.1 ABC transporter ATP-binding protein [Rhodobacteraceae bacterium PD-2]QRF64957.1 ATP-binding cassette domain-containing protein [Ponticoccus alexandrii]